jgi:hypothetical protein
VCLATQTSIDRAHWLLKTVETWTGPISVAIFTPDLEFDISVRSAILWHPKSARYGKDLALTANAFMPKSFGPIEKVLALLRYC